MNLLLRLSAGNMKQEAGSSALSWHRPLFLFKQVLQLTLVYRSLIEQEFRWNIGPWLTRPLSLVLSPRPETSRRLVKNEIKKLKQEVQREQSLFKGWFHHFWQTHSELERQALKSLQNQNRSWRRAPNTRTNRTSQSDPFQHSEPVCFHLNTFDFCKCNMKAQTQEIDTSRWSPLPLQNKSGLLFFFSLLRTQTGSSFQKHCAHFL